MDQRSARGHAKAPGDAGARPRAVEQNAHRDGKNVGHTAGTPGAGTGRRAVEKGEARRDANNAGQPAQAQPSRDEKKRVDADARKKQRALQARRARIDELEARIAATENSIKELEEKMAAPGFYDDHSTAQPLIDRHQALMWEVGGLMSQWEELHAVAESASRQDA